jgi:hypothetical protein
MTDKCDAERNAVRAVWPNAQLLLCAFHRCQAWWRWLKTIKKSGIVSEEGQKVVMASLVAIAEADTSEQLDDRLTAFTQSTHYRTNRALRDYWQREWAWCMQDWVALHRQVWCGMVWYGAAWLICPCRCFVLPCTAPVK